MDTQGRAKPLFGYYFLLGIEDEDQTGHQIASGKC